MFDIFIVYCALVAYYVIKSSKSECFYLFSPLIIIHLRFICSNIYPLIVYENTPPTNIVNVTIISCVLNIIFLLLYRKLWTSKVIMTFPRIIRYKQYDMTRVSVAVFFLGLIVLSGFVTGVTPAILAGMDVENLRRSGEIGLGFIREIPSIGLPILVLEYFLLKKNLSIKKAICIVIVISVLFFLSTGHRRGVAVYLTVFMVWLNFKYRNFKWYEYLGIFYIMQPVIASILTQMRSGVELTIADFSFFDHEKMIFNTNTILLARWIESTGSYLKGYSYFCSFVYIIPRFIWPDKPLSIDYYYKEVVGLDFEGGGIYTTNDFELYLNFGYYYIFFYILYLLIPHYIYKMLCGNKFAYDLRLFFIVVFIYGWSFLGIIKFIELFFLFLLIFFALNKKWRLI